MEAASGIVALVVGVVELVGLQDLHGNFVLGGEGERGGEFSAGKRGGVGDDGEHFLAEGLMRDVGEVSGVGAAGVGDQDAAQLLQSG